MRSLAPDSYLTALRMMPLSYPRIGNFLSKNNHQHAVVSHLDSFAFNIVFSLLPVNSLTQPRIPPHIVTALSFFIFFSLPLTHRIAVFGVSIEGRKEPAIVDIRRIKPAKIVTSEDFWVNDTILNWRLTFKDLFRLVGKGEKTNSMYG